MGEIPTFSFSPEEELARAERLLPASNQPTFVSVDTEVQVQKTEVMPIERVLIIDGKRYRARDAAFDKIFNPLTGRE